MSFVSSHGSRIRWGTTDLNVTAISFSAGSGGEIDITSMESSVRPDPQNSNRKLIARDYDSCFDDGNRPDVSIEFFAGTVGFSLADVGSKRSFSAQFYPPGVSSIIGGDGPPINITGVSAVLTQLQLSGTAGEYVRGSATFKLTGV